MTAETCLRVPAALSTRRACWSETATWPGRGHSAEVRLACWS